MTGPALNALCHQLVDVLESGPLLSVRIRDIPIALPFAQKKRLARCLRRNLGDAPYMFALHSQDQISRRERGVINLPCAMRRAVQAVLFQQLLRGCVYTMVHQRTEAGRRNDYTPLIQHTSQHYLS